MRNLTLLIASGLVALSAYPVMSETKITVNVSAPKPSAMYKAMFKPWMAEVEKATQGRVKIFAPAASLASPPRQWDITAKGVADVAMTANTWQRKRLHLPLIAETPFNVPSAIGGSVAMWRTHKKYFALSNVSAYGTS